ncbi:MucBP domain-containing protein [Listeria innocua]|nr:MucBP domain-containing protein [Listeria innocua]
MDNNEPFIQAIENATSKTRANITQTDLENIKELTVIKASEIPDNIDLLKNTTKLMVTTGTVSSLPDSVGNLKELKELNLSNNNLSTFPMIAFQLPKLESLQLNGGTIEEIPESITEMASHLKMLGVSRNRLVRLPDKIFTTKWTNAGDYQNLLLYFGDNQITSHIPPGASAFNNGNNMAEFYDGQFQKQDQLTTTDGYTLDVTVGTDFSQLTPDKTKLELKSGRALFDHHEFEFYDDGSSQLIQNGVATAPGQTSIYVKSKFSTKSNKFAKTKVTVNIAGPITVKYEDTDGKELASPVILNGKVGDSYTSTEKTFPGYTLVAAPTNQNGTFTLNPATINYVYKLDDYTLTSTYKDTNGQELKAPVVDAKTYHYQDTYATNPEVFPGYTLVETPTNAKGTFDTSNITVDYVYQANAYQLTSTFKDQQGKTIAPDAVDTKTYHINDSYTTKAKTIPGYTLVETPANEKGVFGASDETVNYVYKANDYTLTITYKDDQGKELKAPKVDAKKYHIHDAYKTTALAIPGYTLVEKPANEEGTFGAGDETVNYVYKVNDYTLTTTYKDTEGKELQTPKVDAKKYHIEDAYKTNPEVFPGYTLVETPTNEEGTFGTSDVTVNYIYKANDYTLTTTYKDTEGKELKASKVDTKKYHIEDTYKTTALAIPGYTLVETPANEEGTFGASDVTVNYVYKANDYTLTTIHKDTQGKELQEPKVDAKKYNIQDTYKTTPEVFPGYTLVATPTNAKGTFGSQHVTVNYVYKANGYQLTSTFKDQQGKKIAPDKVDTKTYYMNDPYTTEAKTIPGYTLVTTPANEKGIFGTSDETVNYVYKANDYTLTTTYKDAEGKELQAPNVDTKKYHIEDTYKTTALAIPGYTLVETPANEEGTFGASDVTVNYVYAEQIISKPIVPTTPTMITIETPDVFTIKAPETTLDIFTIKTLESQESITKVEKKTLPKTGDDIALSNLLQIIGIVLILELFLIIGRRKLR